MNILYVKTTVVTCILVITFSNVVGQSCNGGADCIALDKCSGLYRQLQKGSTPALTRLLRSLHCGFENANMPKICCPPEFLSQRGGFGNDQGSARENPLALLPNRRECGIQNNDRIVGGIQTEIDEHPWMVLLRYDKPSGWGFYCGGVLISSRYVLTAAHCVKGSDLPPNWKLSQVRLGEWNTSSQVDCVGDDCSQPVQDIRIEQIIAHESYDPEDNNQQNDIALLRLAQNVHLNDFVKPICLPTTEDLRDSNFDGLEMEVAGWGKTETRTESDVKLKVRVPIVSRRLCKSVYERVERLITDKQLCAGGVEGKDSCRGDSGGALMGQAPSANNWLVVGVVSYGPSPCGTPGWPGVYTRVGAFMDWILSNLRP
ncbi:CLIP domain-containing serine protease 2 isoform X2 [Manduca sexta]|uniref:CLIP domain-containing serine protease n=2 Tax=Manduca sexta TaxID=7130 RepID=A0A921ZW57_MANSE|nr:CLIP domain-containing serine protease 2 isoform X2 [Manduca sexta]KAG6464620.1 hypothetical protein O3G_MSEX014633 [Manduca sexta]KAG6464621.1 hypothetical protein O3G_MSEX014633 [Manduca sexta]KAG6464622.1 hypothetical protein O3G_MSEX014633 [Manduca sexta]